MFNASVNIMKPTTRATLILNTYIEHAPFISVLDSMSLTMHVHVHIRVHARACTRVRVDDE